jgi:hypothetical protein
MATAPPNTDNKLAPPADDSSGDEGSGISTPNRRSNESSPTASLYDHDNVDKGEETAHGAKLIHEYSFFNSTSRLNTISVPGGKSAKDTKVEEEAKYHAENSMWMPGKPGVILRAGPTKEGTIAGVCRLGFGSGTLNVGLGDPDQNDTKWEAVKRHGIFNKEHYEFSIPVNEGSERTTFCWKRTHDKAIGAGLSLKNKKLIDVKTKEVVALYLTNHLKSWRKKGKLIIYKSYGEAWELMVITSLLGLMEKQRRRRVSSMHGSGP